jgi:hypothetical protein
VTSHKSILSLIALLLASVTPVLSQNGAHSGIAMSSASTRRVIAGTYLDLNVCGGVVIDPVQFIAQGFPVPSSVYAKAAIIVLSFPGDQSFLVNSQMPSDPTRDRKTSSPKSKLRLWETTMEKA